MARGVGRLGLGFVLLAAPALAQNWGTLVNVSDTMGVNAGRVCLGEGSRRDIGCPIFAPIVDNFGRLGINISPVTWLDVSPSMAVRRRGGDGAGPAYYLDNKDKTGSAEAELWGIFNMTGGYGNALQFWNYYGISDTPQQILALTDNGRLGLGTAAPTASLTVAGGEIQTASSGIACTSALGGAIRYTGGVLSFCNGSVWTPLSSGSVGDYVLKAGDTMTGNLGISRPEPRLVLNKAASNQWNAVVGQSNGLNQWSLELGNNINDFALARFNSSGVFQDIPLIISQANGDIFFSGQQQIRNNNPTIRLRDTDHRSGFIHQNSNIMYFLNGGSNDTDIWTINGSYWPLALSMLDDSATFGGPAYFMEGNVGIGTTAPSSRLQVTGGEIQTASSGGACTPTTGGAIRYTGGVLSFCNGSGWTNLTAGNLGDYVLKAGDTMTGNLISNPTAANFPGDGSAVTTFEVRGTSTMPATMTFHRPGVYAAYFGLGTDNAWRVGGWSMGAGSSRLWHEGNDGAGSGLDADTLDGWNPSLSNGRLTMAGVGCGGSWASSCDAGNNGWADYADNAGTATDNTKVAKAGDTMTGNLLLRPPGTGMVDLVGGSASNPGYVQFSTSNGTRRGYIGWNSGNRNVIAGEAGWPWEMQSDLFLTGMQEIRNGAPTITFRDFDSRTGYIHTNSGLMYFMGSSANDQGYGNWSTYPLILDLVNARVRVNEVCDGAGNNCRTPAQVAAVTGASCPSGNAHLIVYKVVNACGDNVSIRQCVNGTDVIIHNFNDSTCGGGGGGN